LALTISDVYQNGQPVKDLLFQKDVVKGKETARMVPVNADGRKAIVDLIAWHNEQYGTLSQKRPMFVSRKGNAATCLPSRHRQMTRKTGHIVLKEAFERAGLNGKLATHSLRKSFAQRVYDASGDVVLVQELLGHASIGTTRKYLGVSYQKAQRVVESIATGNRNQSGILLHSSLAESPTDTLVLELARRGYDVTLATRPRDTQTPVAPDEKIIPLERARQAHTTKLRRGQG
jgi:integrase/recombinase XerD